MSNLIGFEIKKFCNRRKNLMVIMIFLILSVIFITFNFTLEKQFEISGEKSIDLQIESLEDSLSDVKSEIIRLPENEKLKKINSNYEKQLNILKDIKIAYASNDFNKYLEGKIQLDKNLLKNIEDGDVISPENPDEIKNDIDINTLLLEKGIAPIYSSVSIEGFNFIKLFLNNPISIILVILIIVLSADAVSSEFDFDTYKLLFTQPISKIKILSSKILATLIMINVIIFGIITICFFMLGFTRGFGSINYPTYFYNNNVIEYISIGKFILFEIVLCLLLTTFICVLSVTISSFSKSSSDSIAISIIIVVFAYMVSKKGFLGDISHLNPFIYIDLSSVLQGDLAKLYDNSNISFKYGILTIILSTVILLLINIFLFQKNNLKVKRVITRK